MGQIFWLFGDGINVCWRTVFGLSSTDWLHSSEIRGLLSMKYSGKMLQIYLFYLMKLAKNEAISKVSYHSVGCRGMVFLGKVCFEMLDILQNKLILQLPKLYICLLLLSPISIQQMLSTLVYVLYLIHRLQKNLKLFVEHKPLIHEECHPCQLFLSLKQQIAYDCVVHGPFEAIHTHGYL